jgi:tetratricopeptide (TPR) repeat protein
MKRNTNILLLVVMITLVILTARWIDADPWSRARAARSSLMAGSSEEAVSLSGLMGLRCLSADALWIETIQYLGDAGHRSEGYRFFLGYLDRIVRLDPNFRYAYIDGSAVLMWLLKRPVQAVELLRRGVENNPDDKEMSRYLFAFTYYKAGEFNRMLPLLEQIVFTRSHPPMVERILGNLYEKLGQMDRAHEYWRWMLANPSEPENEEYARSHLSDR